MIAAELEACRRGETKRLIINSTLPIGIQIIRRRNDDWSMLQERGYAFEHATNVGARDPASASAAT